MSVHPAAPGFLARCPSRLCGWSQWFSHRADAQAADLEHGRGCRW